VPISIAVEQLAAQDSFEDAVLAGLSPETDPGILAGKEFSRCTFRNIQLHATRWARTRLEECVFESCDLSRANPAQLSLRDVTFKNCKLMGIDWSGLESFPAMRFESCNLRYASFVRLALNKTHFALCALTEASFIETQLVEASFDGCELTGARFDRCDLRRASFAETRGLLLDAKNNNVKGARIPVEAALRLAESLGLHIAQ
jgi:uncharacterized protein YjbI with pentapeptide repeats